MKDLAIYETGDGGDVNLINNDLELRNTLFNQVYLALFGGNTKQVTAQELNNLDERFDWWGNSLFDKENQFNSRFENALRNVVINGSGLQHLENIAKEDLAFIKPYANYKVEVSMVDFNKIQIEIWLQEPDKRQMKIVFLWDGAKKELLYEEIPDTIITNPLDDLWILATGYWNDDGIWVDSAYWQDGP